MALLARPHRFTAVQRALLILLLSLLSGSLGLGQTVTETEVKAVFLYNFAKFVDWPAGSFKTPADPIVICAVGENTLRGSLEDAVRNKTVDGRGLVIRRVPEACRTCGCRILFFPAGESRLKPELAQTQGSAILTVGETDAFADDGGMINFKLVDARVRLEINVAAAEREKIRISSKLLGLARIVKK